MAMVLTGILAGASPKNPGEVAGGGEEVEEDQKEFAHLVVPPEHARDGRTSELDGDVRAAGFGEDKADATSGPRENGEEDENQDKDAKLGEQERGAGEVPTVQAMVVGWRRTSGRT